MRYNILIGGKAGQGINKISEIVSNILVEYGYFTFNYRDYPSLIRGGHNFNVLSISDERVGSIETKLDIVVAMDKNTIEVHKNNLRNDGIIIEFEEFKDLGRNLNVAQAGALIKILGISKELLINEVEEQFHNKDSNAAAELGYNSQKEKFNLSKLNNKINIMSGSQAIAQGAINSKIDLYVAYPMTPATGVLHELAGKAKEKGFEVFQPENEIAVVNSGLGASFTGSKAMIGTSGGGYDLMTEGLSLQGQSEIPLVVYLCSRPGPGTGVPTYTSQADLDIALRGGHGEFPRVVIAPGDPIECVEKTNEAFFLAEKFKTLSIVLSDKHLAESEFSSDRFPNKIISFKVNRKLPGQAIVKTSSYERDNLGNTTEGAELTKQNADKRIMKYEQIQKAVREFEMIKIFGNKNSKNLVIGWGSTKAAILDAIKGEDFKFLQVLYMKPLSDEIKKEIEKANKVILVENNLTGQLGRLIREKTGISIKNRILKYDGRAFNSDELKKEILGIK
jgi:2-oxoglutarate/2-oxoacid ferredoxin oxidoreductase subunit alpha